METDMAGSALQDWKDLQDVVHFLQAHPEWLPDLQRVLFTKDLLALPEQVTRLTEQVVNVTTY